MVPTIEFVQSVYDRFNIEIFGGQLPAIPMRMSHARSFIGKVQYKYVRGLFGRIKGYTDYKLVVSTFYDLAEQELEDVVIHEMIHYWILTRGIKDSSSHGRVFRAMMKDINSRYGRHITISHKITPQPAR